MEQFSNLMETVKEENLIYDGKMLHVYNDKVTLPNGGEATREYVRHIGAVAVVPVTDEGNIIIEKQYRYPVARVVTEIPAGKLDSKQEDRLEAAKRELLEETGIIASEWIKLCDFAPASAYSDEHITLYLAKGFSRGKQQLDTDEFLNVEEVPFEDVLSDVLEGRIIDGKTQIAIMQAAIKLGYLK